MKWRAQPANTFSGADGEIVQVLGVLRLANWWSVGGELASAGGPGITMNTDLQATAMRGEDLAAVVAVWRSGAISRESMLELLKRGEMLPDGRTVAQERALIHRKRM